MTRKVNGSRESIRLTRRGLLEATAGAATAGATVTATTGTARAQPYGGYLDDVENFEGTADARGMDPVELKVGVEPDGFLFGPSAAVLIEPGTTIEWMWTGRGGNHNVVHDPEVVDEPTFDSRPTHEGGVAAAEGTTFEHTFEEAGIFEYVCTPHRSLGMKGVIVVGEDHVEGNLVEFGFGPGESSDGWIGTTELAAAGGSIGLLTLLGGYFLYRRSGDADNHTDATVPSPSEHQSDVPSHTEADTTGQKKLLDQTDIPRDSAMNGEHRKASSVHRETREILESTEKNLEGARKTLDDGMPEQALYRLNEVHGTFEEARGPINEYDFTDLREHLHTLETRYERLHKAAEEALTPVPSFIPNAPDLSLTYHDIQKGDQLGRGGNADVFHATARTDDGEVELAVKEPRVGGTLHTETVERMMAEAETWQQLDDHDHIVGVVDFDSTPLPWIAMEYMDGGHLGERIDEMAIEQKLWTAIAVTEGVEYAHRRGVAHRDLKPANILFREIEDAWDAPKVADWGLSKHLLEHSKSRDGMTVAYAAPEQFSDDVRTDDRTDIYQLGAVFYELFTGRPPFEGEMFAVMEQIKTEVPTPPSELADLPPELDEVLLRALAKDRDERHDHVVLLRNDLRKLFES